MTALQQPGTINDLTTLIDLGMNGSRGITALLAEKGHPFDDQPFKVNNPCG